MRLQSCRNGYLVDQKRRDAVIRCETGAVMSLRHLRIICAVVFVGGIGGLIMSSILGNNNGTVLTIGAPTAIAAIALLAASSVVNREPIDAFSDARAEQLEATIQQLISAGAPESQVRDLVRESMRLGRGT
jgi:hypothetical protein